MSKLEIIALSGVVYKVEVMVPTKSPVELHMRRSDIPYQSGSLYVNVAWSMLSKAAEK